MNQRPDFVESKREMKRLHDEHVKETSEGNTRIHLVQWSRQRRPQQFEWLKEYTYQVDAQTGWRFYPSKSEGILSRNPTRSSSSIQISGKLEFLAIVILDWTVVFFCSEMLFHFSLAWKWIPWQPTECIDRYTCRTPHFHMYRHSTDHTAQMTCVNGSRSWKAQAKFELRPQNRSFIHASCFTWRLAVHWTPGQSSLSLASLVLLSSSSPNPDLLSTHPCIHCEDPRQEGTSTEFHSSTG